MFQPFMTLQQAATALKAGQLSSVELVECMLDRIRRFDSQLHAFITVTEELAMTQARRADAERKQGVVRGALHGIPVALKDNVFVNGVRTTCHSRVMRNAVADDDAFVVQRLQQAGAVILGKVALWEFAYGVPAPDDEIPAARNPWSLAHSPGGSSSGSGACVAAGMAFGAVGTDTGGSIRHPSSVCGVVGMKPTFGLVSQRGVVPVSLSLDHIGPMTLTVRDNALMLQAMAGHDAADPNSAAVDANPDFTARIGQPLKGLRAGVPMNLIDPGGLDQRVVQAFERALDVLRDLGLEVEIFEMAGVEAVHADSSLILEYEAYREHEVRLKAFGPLYGEGLRRRLMNGAQRHAPDYARAKLKAAALQQSVDRLLTERYSVLLMPGREAPALTLEQLYGETPSARGRMTRLGNMTGVPSLVLPMGFSEQPKLPLALQVVAARFHEPVVYQVAAAYEAAQPWVSQHPEWLC